MNFDGRSQAETSTSAIIAGLQRSRDITRRFGKEEDGVMTYFAFFMLFMMLLVGGIGVDLMQNEMQRTRLQATVDRAVLAATDLDQELDPVEVVTDYFAKSGVTDFTSAVPVDEGLNFRAVNATASTTSSTRFMKFMGVDELPVPAIGTAEERVSNVEISLVLDISGSMGRDSKLENMQDAAGVFVDTVLKEESQDLISINLVPYTAQVNAGETIYGELLTDQRHNYSHCVDFDPEDFSTTTLSFTKIYQQMQHFESSSNWSGSREVDSINNPGCPKRSYEDIYAYSQTPDDLKDRINQYRARANTSIHLGMKWGAAMLDPTFRSINQELSSNGESDPAFSTRPAEYSDDETLKTIVLMTDGQNVDTYRIQPRFYSTPSLYADWSRFPLFFILNNFVPSSEWNEWRFLKYSSAEADGFLGSICTAAKDQGVVVWSVGFEVTDFAAGIMRNCASSPSHFFRVEGVEISDAFEAIAKQINQLRLTQ